MPQFPPTVVVALLGGLSYSEEPAVSRFIYLPCVVPWFFPFRALRSGLREVWSQRGAIFGHTTYFIIAGSVSSPYLGISDVAAREAKNKERPSHCYVVSDAFVASDDWGTRFYDGNGNSFSVFPPPGHLIVLPGLKQLIYILLFELTNLCHCRLHGEAVQVPMRMTQNVWESGQTSNAKRSPLRCGRPISCDHNNIHPVPVSSRFLSFRPTSSTCQPGVDPGLSCQSQMTKNHPHTSLHWGLPQQFLALQDGCIQNRKEKYGQLKWPTPAW